MSEEQDDHELKRQMETLVLDWKLINKGGFPLARANNVYLMYKNEVHRLRKKLKKEIEYCATGECQLMNRIKELRARIKELKK